MSLHVIFRVADAEYALAASDVMQMESYQGATIVPGGPAYLAGIVMIRGKIVPVVDLRARFGLSAQAPTLDTRIVVGQVGERTVGLLADSAREVATLSSEQWKPPPPMVARQASGFIRAVAQLGTRLVMLIDFHKVVGEEQLHE